MTAERNPGTAPVFRAFIELAGLPPEQRREALMERLEHVWKQAQDRSYKNKHGDEIPAPDGTLQLKVIQAVAVLHGMTGPVAEAEEAKLARLSDADLVREATKRLPPHEIAALADSLIALREQQRSRAAIVTTGETEYGIEEAQQRPRTDKPRVPKPRARRPAV